MSKISKLVDKFLPNNLDQSNQIRQDIFSYSSKLSKEVNECKLLNGRILSNQNQARIDEIINDIHKSEFQVFSQWGDDGIIQFLVNYLDIENKTFIEFGVENYKEANTRFLLINNNWSGLIMDGSENYMNQVKSEDIYWKYNLISKPAFITKENINKLIESCNIRGEIGLLHIDIDGNDFWVWKEISCISPVIVIVEYNSVFGNSKPLTIPYKKDFNRTDSHFSNLYFGSSLTSLCDLAKSKGYIFIGCNSNGNNAYFVKKDKAKKLKSLTVKQGYVCSKFRESRDINGNLTYISGTDRLKQIKGMKIYNTKTDKNEII
jgi:hypothetical protein